MNEQEPKYITNLENRLKEYMDDKFENHEPKYFIKFKEELNERLDGHAEQIASVSEEISGIKKTLKEHGGILDMHTKRFDEIEAKLDEKADTAYVNQIGNRVKKLEKHVFA
jgi:hypothetical protein